MADVRLEEVLDVCGDATSGRGEVGRLLTSGMLPCIASGKNVVVWPMEVEAA